MDPRLHRMQNKVQSGKQNDSQGMENQQASINFKPIVPNPSISNQDPRLKKKQLQLESRPGQQQAPLLNSASPADPGPNAILHKKPTVNNSLYGFTYNSCPPPISNQGNFMHYPFIANPTPHFFPLPDCTIPPPNWTAQVPPNVNYTTTTMPLKKEACCSYTELNTVKASTCSKPLYNNQLNNENTTHDRNRSNMPNKERDNYRARSPQRRRSSPRRRSRSRSRSRERKRRSLSRDSKSSRRSSRSRDSYSTSYSRTDSSGQSRSYSRRSRSRSRRRRSCSKESRESSSRRSRSRSRRRRSCSKESRESSSRRSSERDRRKSSDVSRREALIERWRRLNCKNDEELEKRLLQLSKMNDAELLLEQSSFWIRSAPATTYYERDKSLVNLMHGTPKLKELHNEFYNRLIGRCKEIRAGQKLRLPPRPPKHNHIGRCIHKAHDSCSSSSDDEPEMGSEESLIMEELQRKMQHPYRLHKELWYNEPGEMNDGLLCKCSIKAKRSGIRHGIYAGEKPEPLPSFCKRREKESNISPNIEAANKNMCDPETNNAGKLYHYRITISPPTNFLSKTPTIITYDGHEFIFSGFSLFSHYPLPKLPVCKVIRFNIEYVILYAEESFPENFTIKECDMFFEYLFREILELVDLDLYASPEKCPIFHFMPRFVRELKPEGHELLPMCQVLLYLLSSYKPLVPKELLPDIPKTSKSAWQDFADEVKGMIVTKPGMKPSSIRVDQLDKDVEVANTTKDDVAVKKEPSVNGSDGDTKVTAENTNFIPYPEIIHFGVRPPQLSYAGNQDYQKVWREYVKHRHLIANLSKPTPEDKQKVATKEAELQRMRTKSNMKRDVTATVSSEGFYRTGLMCDVVQHAMLIPVLSCHLRFHRSLNILEDRLGYVFKNRGLLQLALTHPSYRENFGTNPDHARNSLTNCGIRQPEYGDRRIHYMSSKKRGINTLMNIMSKFGSNKEEESNIYHNERLEFLGDAVIEFVSTIHLFHMFRDLEEGGLATYRAALVQNQHLAVLAKVLSLDAFLLYAHGSDLCHDLELNHALANCFEALMGALFLDGAIDVADRVFGETVFGESEDLLQVWEKYPPHPLQEQEPEGDRRWIEKVEFLQKMSEFEESIGVEFNHIRLLARAFTDRSIGYTNLTLGSNQRLEFLGDSVLQLVASEYLYKHFPDHHEGHLSLLRSSLVNNNTQSVVCDDLGMTFFARYAASKGDLKVKDKADLLEAFLGALYIDKRSLKWVEHFCNVCFFPRLQDFIMNQEWNDPKSKLQQCCLTLRTMDGGEPDIPCYKVVECKGPTNTRTYSVAVYFKNKRLATATGHSIQQAEMNAAQAAMKKCGDLFPNFDNTKRNIQRTKGPEKDKRLDERRNLRCSRSNSTESSRHQRRTRSQSREERRDRSSSREVRENRSRSRSCDRRYKRERSSSSESVRRDRSISSERNSKHSIIRCQRKSRSLSSEKKSDSTLSPNTAGLTNEKLSNKESQGKHTLALRSIALEDL